MFLGLFGEKKLIPGMRKDRRNSLICDKNLKRYPKKYRPFCRDAQIICEIFKTLDKAPGGGGTMQETGKYPERNFIF